MCTYRYKKGYLTVSAVLIVLASPGLTYAYLDPGTGSYVLQVFLGLALSAWFSMKVFGAKLRGIVSKWFKRGKIK